MTRSPRSRTTYAVLASAVVLLGAAGTAVALAGSGDRMPYDLGTPELAARSFARAAVEGNGPELLELTCVAHPECITRQGEASPDQVAEAKKIILNGVDQLGDQLSGAEFGEVTEAAMPGAVEVEYRTPAMPAGQRHTLIFVELDGRWLYVGSAGTEA